MRGPFETLPGMLRVVVVLFVLVGVLAACVEEPQTAPDTGPGAAAVEVGGEEGTVRTPATAGDPGLVEPSGPAQTFELGELGEVDVVVVSGRRLELVEVRDGPGWSHRIDEVGHDEIELEFEHVDGRSSEVEIELAGGVARVVIG